MGTAKKSIITIVFEDETPLGITSKTALEQSLIKFYQKQNPEFIGEPSITITDFEIDGCAVNLEMYSTRCVNLDFQVDLLSQYLDEYNVEEFYYDNWVQSD